ncbi:hypothetical protein J1N35_034880 [Gossypium stocksii]|uniref:Uncharacterized protein n=1 Tax=Gossypium stocksii TaxID=47602 RepID=A0A9D3ZR49_9ROSI|nr:hypothetical protein J1N35_034880 [Gossypium stocksii]
MKTSMSNYSRLRVHCVLAWPKTKFHRQQYKYITAVVPTIPIIHNLFCSFILEFIRCIISFCDNEKQESALSNWPRAKTRAAKWLTLKFPLRPGEAIIAAGRLAASQGVLENCDIYDDYASYKVGDDVDEPSNDACITTLLSLQSMNASNVEAPEQLNLSPRATHGQFGNSGPIPSPRPSHMGLPSLRVAIVGMLIIKGRKITIWALTK